MNRHHDIPFIFGPGENTFSKNFYVDYSQISNNYDYLIFIDSKGISSDKYQQSWAQMIVNDIKLNNKSYLLIVRPKNLTVFFTLINFLRLNNLGFKNLITNLGFVDLTPKKLSLLNDLIFQNPFKIELDIINHGPYIDKNNNKIDLFGLSFNSKILLNISQYINNFFSNVFFFHTIEFNKHINIERERPVSFFNQLSLSNKLINELSSYIDNSCLIRTNDFIVDFNSNKYSYDAVHYTNEGHKLLYEIWKSQIKKY